MAGVENIEQIRLKYMKELLNVMATTNSCAVCGELDKSPLNLTVIHRILKYWVQISNDRDSLIYKIYNFELQNYTITKYNCASSTRNLLVESGFRYLWINQNDESLRIPIEST